LPDGRTPKGYLRDDFEDAWGRYPAGVGDPDRNTATSPGIPASTSEPPSATPPLCSGSVPPSDFPDLGACGGVAGEFGEGPGDCPAAHGEPAAALEGRDESSWVLEGGSDGRGNLEPATDPTLAAVGRAYLRWNGDESRPGFVTPGYVLAAEAEFRRAHGRRISHEEGSKALAWARAEGEEKAT
jgi:hypothetical protein